MVEKLVLQACRLLYSCALIAFSKEAVAVGGVLRRQVAC